MFCEHEGRKLFYSLDGSSKNTRLFLLNSIGTTTRSWDGLVDFLTTDFQVLRMDKSGHGRSDPCRSGRQIADNVTDALAVLDAVGWDATNLCGVSIGGMTGMAMAASHGHRIRRLVLSNTSAYIPVADHLRDRIRKIRESGVEGIAEEQVARFFPDGISRPEDQSYARTLSDFRGCDAESLIRWYEAIITMDLRPDLEKITAPTYVVAGRHDVATPPDFGREVAKKIRGAEFIELATGHLPYLGDPEGYAELLRTRLLD